MTRMASNIAPSEHEVACAILHAVLHRDWSSYAYAIIQSDALQRSGVSTRDFQKTIGALQTALIETMKMLDPRFGRATERYETHLLPAMKRFAHDNGLSFSADAPVQSLVQQLRFDRWPPSDEDARIIDVLARAYDAVMDESSHGSFDRETTEL